VTEQANRYRGERLGLPASGPGSIAAVGRRVAALLVDWVAATMVTLLISGGRLTYGSPDFSFAVLGVFGVEVFLLTWLSGASFGQRLLRIRVVSLDRGPIGPVRALGRTVLICLAIPPLIWDRDTRGLHDRAVDTAVVNS
jgi:uncharacterized RDD family membrane protein YckC